jgi:hypothetical protein
MGLAIQGLTAAREAIKRILFWFALIMSGASPFSLWQQQ